MAVCVFQCPGFPNITRFFFSSMNLQLDSSFQKIFEILSSYLEILSSSKVFVKRKPACLRRLLLLFSCLCSYFFCISVRSNLLKGVSVPECHKILAYFVNIGTFNYFAKSRVCSSIRSTFKFSHLFSDAQNIVLVEIVCSYGYRIFNDRFHLCGKISFLYMQNI